MSRLNKDGGVERPSLIGELHHIPGLRAGKALRCRGRAHECGIVPAQFGDGLGPLLQPPEIQYPLEVELPLYLKDYRATLLQHPAAQWAAGVYRLHRGHSAEDARRTTAA